MIDEKLIRMLRCPIDDSKLALADQPLLQRVNDAIQRGELRDRHDQKVTQSARSRLARRTVKSALRRSWRHPNVDPR